MVQDSRIIDLRKSYLPGDPNSFPTKLPNTGSGEGDDRADPESGRFPILPYDGYNFMPTPQGYSSFFGTASQLQVDALTGNVDEIFVVQKTTYENLAIAFKDDGLWVKDLGSSGAWTQAVAMTVPAPGIHKSWSKCVIDQDLYFYRQGEAFYIVAGPSTAYAITTVVPNGLTMDGQVGIFKAGGRLAFWDVLNSIAWSAFEDKSDFNDSLQTLAGKAIFQDIVGRITNVLQHGEGFVIYCTKSIVNVRRNVESPMLFEGDSIFNNNGISYRNQVVMSDPDTTHFVLTTTGFCEISQGKSTYSVPDISRYFKEQTDPMFLQLLNGKFLFFSFISPDYNVGRFNFNFIPGYYEPGQLAEWAVAYTLVSGITSIITIAPGTGVITEPYTREQATDAVVTINENFDQVYLNRQFGYTNYQQATAGQVPIWQDHIVSCIPLADIEAFKPYAERHEGEQYFYSTGFTNGDLVLIDGSTASFLPTKNPDPTSAFNTTLHIQPNTRNFYTKQDAIFYYEGLFYDAWLQAVEENIKRIQAETAVLTYADTPFTNTETSEPIELVYDIGSPFVAPTFYSTKSKYYGASNKSAWLQRSLVQGRQIKVKSHVENRQSTQMLSWRAPFNPAPLIVGTVSAALASGPMLCSLFDAIATGNGNGFLNPHFVVAIYDNAMGVGAPFREVRFNISNQALGNETVVWSPYDVFTSTQILISPDFYNLHAGMDVYQISTISTQTFSDISEPVEFPVCTYKELGYTSIIGHGHYTAFGQFIQDNATPEAPDYVDICIPSAKPNFPVPQVGNGVFDTSAEITHPAVEGGPFVGTVVTIDDIPYSYMEGSDVIPTAPTDDLFSPFILLQPGSIEPIYPTFVGAFIYDIHFKKWGKMKMNYKNLLDVFPVNTMAGEGTFPYTHFLPKMGARLANGTIPVFDERPTDSQIVFGKVGYYRKGFTDLEELIIHNRTYKNGTIQIEPSIDGRNIDNSQIEQRPYTKAAVVREGFNMSARWYNITVKGAYDLIHLEIKTVRRGKR